MHTKWDVGSTGYLNTSCTDSGTGAGDVQEEPGAVS